MMEGNGVAARLDELFRRADRADKIRSDQWKEINRQDKVQTGFEKDIKNIRDDISDLGEQMKWIRRGMWVAAGTFTTFILMLAAVLVAVVS